MEIEELRKIIKFSYQEKIIINKLGIHPDLFLPVLLSIRSGGDWSYVSEDGSSVSVKVKTTKYDDERKLGYTLEEIYLLINPQVHDQEGNVVRLEKCGLKEERILVNRPYSVEITADRIIKTSVHPEKKVIQIEELRRKEITLRGSDAYDFMHEYEHLTQKEIKGDPLWGFDYLLKE